MELSPFSLRTLEYTGQHGYDTERVKAETLRLIRLNIKRGSTKLADTQFDLVIFEATSYMGRILPSMFGEPCIVESPAAYRFRRACQSEHDAVNTACTYLSTCDGTDDSACMTAYRALSDALYRANAKAVLSLLEPLFQAICHADDKRVDECRKEIGKGTYTTVRDKANKRTCARYADIVNAINAL